MSHPRGKRPLGENVKCRDGGFTFVEVMIAVAIIMILSVASLSSYGNFREQKKLETNSTALIEVLELAKKKSITADKSSLISGGTDYSSCDLSGFKVNIISQSTYSLSAQVCDNAGACPLASGCSDITLQTYQTTPPVVLSPTTGTVTFNTATKDETGLKSITLTHQNSSKTRSITISSSGVIE